jgi:hypothetical protein
LWLERMLHGTGEVSASYHAMPRLTLVLITPHDHFHDSSVTHVDPSVVACRSVTHLATVRTFIFLLGLAEQAVGGGQYVMCSDHCTCSSSTWGLTLEPAFEPMPLMVLLIRSLLAYVATRRSYVGGCRPWVGLALMLLHYDCRMSGCDPTLRMFFSNHGLYCVSAQSIYSNSTEKVVQTPR